MEVFANILLIFIILFWTLVWKGYALWTAASRKKKWWFIVMLIVNTIGILEIIYLFAVEKKRLDDIRRDFHIKL